PLGELEERLKTLSEVYRKPVPSPSTNKFRDYVKQLTDSCGPLFPWLGGAVEPALAYTEDVEEPDGTTAAPGNGAQVLNATLVQFPSATFGLMDESLVALRHAALADLAREDDLNTPPKLSPRTNQFTRVTPFGLTGLINDQPNEIKEINDADFLFSYEAFLAGLASLPGPTPHGQLNLCQFATYTRPAANVGKRIMVIAAPVLTLTTGIQRQPDWAGTKWKRYDTRAPKRLMAII